MELMPCPSVTMGRQMCTNNWRPLNRTPASLSRRPLDPHGILRPVVEHQHQSSTDVAEHIRQEALVQACGEALLGRDLLEAISRALVEMLLHRLFGLHLQTAH